jgi:uncharacterized cupredoxin-like copper-binding protein
MKRIAILAAAVVSAACAKQDAKVDSSKIAQAGATDAPREVTVTAQDFSYTAPDSIPAGITTFKLVNNGTTLHHMIIVRLDSGKTMADVAAAMKDPHAPPPAWAVMVGGPNAPDPKGTSNATVDLAPGNYVLLCAVDVPGGVPHFAKGMVKALTVTPSEARGVAPVASDSITLNDYSFKLSRPLTAGTHTFRVVSEANQPHEVEIIKLAPGKKPADLFAWMQKPAGPPPGNAIGGTSPAGKGIATWFTADFTAGDYLIVCFVPGPDGKPHFMHGMQLVQTVQ